METVASQIAKRHVGAKAFRALRAKGIEFIGTCVIPGEGPLAFANGTTGYQVSDNGTGKVWTLLEVLAQAGVR